MDPLQIAEIICMGKCLRLHFYLCSI